MAQAQTRSLSQLARDARRAARALAAASTAQKDAALTAMARLLEAETPALLAANAADLEAATELSAALQDRLRLTARRVEDMARALDEVAALPDPVGEVSGLTLRPNGLQVGRMRVPLGVILMVYEARPNVTAEAGALCLKSGNAALLRGGSEAFRSNRAIAGLWAQALSDGSLPPASVQLVPTTDRAAVDELLQMDELIDLVIPRGGEGLIRRVVARSKIPVIQHYKGVCHLFVDESADLEAALALTVNGKVQRPGVCNALEKLLVHEAVAEAFLPQAAEALRAHGVALRGCARACALAPEVAPASEEDWTSEYLDLTLAVRVVAGFEEALDHIARYGSLHTEAIATSDYYHAQEFLRRVDASCVLVNASTRFNDGGQLGLGAEIGISTSKLHAFGPMGLRELTTRKFIVLGRGQVRP